MTRLVALSRSFSVLLLLSLSATPALSDGITTSLVDDRPCETPLVSWEDFQRSWEGDNAEWGYTVAQQLWEMRCGVPAVPVHDDETLIRFLFNGHHIPKPAPAPIPVPATGLLMLSALMVLGGFRMMMSSLRVLVRRPM